VKAKYEEGNRVSFRLGTGQEATGEIIEVFDEGGGDFKYDIEWQQPDEDEPEAFINARDTFSEEDIIRLVGRA
jgi:hypothetical protein